MLKILKRASFPTKNSSHKSARHLPMSRAPHILTIFFGKVQMTRGQRARVISHQKLVPQIRASFTQHARASSTRRYACFTRGQIFLVKFCFSGRFPSRINCAQVPSQQILTTDSVTLTVDAVVYYRLTLADCPAMSFIFVK